MQGQVRLKDLRFFYVKKMHCQLPVPEYSLFLLDICLHCSPFLVCSLVLPAFFSFQHSVAVYSLSLLFSVFSCSGSVCFILLSAYVCCLSVICSVLAALRHVLVFYI